MPVADKHLNKIDLFDLKGHTSNKVLQSYLLKVCPTFNYQVFIYKLQNLTTSFRASIFAKKGRKPGTVKKQSGIEGLRKVSVMNKISTCLLVKPLRSSLICSHLLSVKQLMFQWPKRIPWSLKFSMNSLGKLHEGVHSSESERLELLVGKWSSYGVLSTLKPGKPRK